MRPKIKWDTKTSICFNVNVLRIIWVKVKGIWITVKVKLLCTEYLNLAVHYRALDGDDFANPKKNKSILNIDFSTKCYLIWKP